MPYLERCVKAFLDNLLNFRIDFARELSHRIQRFNIFVNGENMACPSCNSDEWKSASLVYQEGLSAVGSKSGVRGIVVGGSGVNLGLGKIKTKGYQQTVLSSLATPPKGGFLFTKILAGLIILFFFGAFSSSFPIGNVAIIIILTLVVSQVYPREKRKRDRAVAIYVSTRVCLRCGQFYRTPLKDESEFVHYREQSGGNTRVLALIVLVLIVVFTLFVFIHKPQDESRKQTEIQTLSANDKTAPAEKPASKDLSGYYAVYQEKDVIYLRTLFDNYLAGRNISDDEDRSGEYALLDKVDKSYYKSRFIVYTFNKAIGGGNSFDILFLDKPDVLFHVWIYQLGGTKPDLRMFESVGLTDEQMKVLRTSIHQFIDDKGHSM